MSDHSHTPEPATELFDARKAKGLASLFGGAGIVSFVIALVLGLLIDGNTKQFAFSWLWGLAFVFTITCGALFWVLVHHATDAEWSVAVRRLLENMGSGFALQGVLFLAGIVFFAPLLFGWWDLKPGQDAILDKKAAYLNQTAFYIRAVFYFVALGVVAFLIRRNSVKQDEDGNPAYTVRNRKLAFIGIPALGLSLTFAAVDWLMSLDWHWFSTMWGVYIFAGGVGAAMGLLVILVTWLKANGYLKIVTVEHYHIMGKLMLAFCVFWAYIGYSQYMLIWYANLPEETIYFIRRNTETWWYLSIILVVGRFFLPFPLLLFQATKKNPKVLCLVAGWLLLMHALDLYLVILPILHVKGFSPSWLDLFCFLGFVGTAVGFFFWKLPKSNLYPARDPRILESIRLSN